jgi:hypothetical protein
VAANVKGQCLLCNEEECAANEGSNRVCSRANGASGTCRADRGFSRVTCKRDLSSDSLRLISIRMDHSIIPYAMNVYMLE